MSNFPPITHLHFDTDSRHQKSIVYSTLPANAALSPDILFRRPTRFDFSSFDDGTVRLTPSFAYALAFELESIGRELVCAAHDFDETLSAGDLPTGIDERAYQAPGMGPPPSLPFVDVNFNTTLHNPAKLHDVTREVERLQNDGRKARAWREEMQRRVKEVPGTSRYWNFPPRASRVCFFIGHFRSESLAATSESGERVPTDIDTTSPPLQHRAETTRATIIPSNRRAGISVGQGNLRLGATDLETLAHFRAELRDIEHDPSLVDCEPLTFVDPPRHSRLRPDAPEFIPAHRRGVKINIDPAFFPERISRKSPVHVPAPFQPILFDLLEADATWLCERQANNLSTSQFGQSSNNATASTSRKRAYVEDCPEPDYPTKREFNPTNKEETNSFCVDAPVFITSFTQEIDETLNAHNARLLEVKERFGLSGRSSDVFNTPEIDEPMLLSPSIGDQALLELEVYKAALPRQRAKRTGGRPKHQRRSSCRL